MSNYNGDENRNRFNDAHQAGNSSNQAGNSSNHPGNSAKRGRNNANYGRNHASSTNNTSGRNADINNADYYQNKKTWSSTSNPQESQNRRQQNAHTGGKRSNSKTWQQLQRRNFSNFSNNKSRKTAKAEKANSTQPNKHVKKNKRHKSAPRRLIYRSEYQRNVREITGASRKNMRYQTIIIWILIIVLLLRILYLLVDLTIVNNKKYTELAASTHSEQYNIYPERGNIYAANGTELATSTFTYNIGVSPKVFGPRKNSEYSEADVINTMSEILAIDPKEFTKLLKDNAESEYVVVKNNISAEDNDKLTDFLDKASVRGVRQDANQARYYPEGKLASSILGFARKSDQGLDGITGVELTYDNVLKGKAGYVYEEVDNYWGEPLPGTLEANIDMQKGYNLRLTIQEDLQKFVQDRARYIYDSSNPQSGAQIMVLDTRDGSILAYSNELEYDLNDVYKAPLTVNPDNWDPFKNKEQLDYLTGTVWNNKAVRYPFEVGSVVKPLVLGMAMDQNTVDENTIVSDDFITIDGWTISSYDNRSRGNLTIPEAIWDSRNTPFDRIAQKLGKETFYSYIDALGMRSITGTDLPNEVYGIFHQNPTELDMAVTSFGEQVTMTLMQLANSYLVIANDGKMITPHVADAILDDEGNVIRKYNQQVKKQVYSEESMRYVRDVMVGVGRYGTAKPAYVPGYNIAYKTGTSSRNKNNDGGPDDLFTHLAIALFPEDNPKYLIITVVHDLDSSGDFVTHEVLGDIISYIVFRDNMPANMKAYDYNYIFRRVYTNGAIGRTPKDTAYNLNFAASSVVKDSSLAWTGTINSQYPPAGSLNSMNYELWVSGENNALPETYVILPDFRGMTASEAKLLAKSLHLNVSFEGYNRAGKCTGQTVMYSDLAGGSKVGDKIRTYSTINLEFAGEDKPGPTSDDSIVSGYTDGSY